MHDAEARAHTHGLATILDCKSCACPIGEAKRAGGGGGVGGVAAADNGRGLNSRRGGAEGANKGPFGLHGARTHDTAQPRRHGEGHWDSA